MKKIACAFAVFILALPCFHTPAKAFEPTSFELHCEAAILINMDTETVVFEYSKDGGGSSSRVYPASITKIMTAVVVLEKQSDLEEIVEVPDYCIELLVGTNSSNAGLVGGEKMSVRDLLYCLMVSSANDAANVLADHFGAGTGEARIADFISQMNRRAGELQMTGTHFANAHGLHDENHYTTIDDLVKLVNHAMELPLFMELCETTRYEIPATGMNEARILSTTNMMMDSSTSFYYKGISGVKTGYTEEAGRCLISTARQNGFRYLCVVMGCPPEDENGEILYYQYEDTENLYDWAFDTFEYKLIVQTSEPLQEIKVNLSSDADHVQLYPERSFSSLVPKEADTSSVITNIRLFSDEIDAPVVKGAVLGTADIVYAGEVLGQVNLVAGQDVERSIVLYIIRQLGEMTHTLWFKLAAGLIGGSLLLLIILTVIQNRRQRMRYSRKRSASRKT
ncbi:MAG TPA: hypothetical protein DEQ02_08260 [Ruminococcaceae bacterium]|nr:hypothetical protein [Oscillospiraceae bacterium]